MSGSKQTESTPNSVILTDWGADVENLGKSPDAILYELLLLSLLYDKILVQDEVLALSKRMSRWFLTAEYKEILIKCFELGTVVVLKHPLFAYPTDDLRDLSLKAPILARAMYIQRFGTKGQEKFTPDELQLALYHVIDSFLLGCQQAQRPAGSLKKVDIMPAFASILKDVLSSKHHTKWRNAAFRGITDLMREDFLRFIDRPEIVVARFGKTNRDFVTLLGPEGIPVFNRSFAFQAANLYPPRQAKAMQRLVQTTFTAPFCWREDAAGRYSRSLRELLWLPPGASAEVEGYEHMDDIVSVEAVVDVSVGLPDLSTDFVEAIALVRNTKAGKRLRQAVRQVGAQAGFRLQNEAWLEVADVLACSVTKRKPINIRISVIRIGKEIVLGSVAGGLISVATGAATTIPSILTSAFFGGAIGISFDHGYEVLRSDLVHQELRSKLEKAVELRCTSLAMPPLVTEIMEEPG